MDYVNILNQYADYLGRKHPLFTLEDERDPWIYTASVILSGNTTDAAVNAIMPAFKERFPTPESILEESVTRETIIPYLRGINHNGSKSDYLKNAAQHIIDQGGETARDIKELTQVTGIGRKTAAIILFRLYNEDQGFPLDTHCLRVLQRLGWFPQKRPKSLENALLEVFPAGTRHQGHLILTHHGREVCHPKEPLCHECRLAEYCAYAKERVADFKSQVSVLLNNNYGIEWEDAAGDNLPLLKALAADESAEQFVNWWAEKHGLTPIAFIH